MESFLTSMISDSESLDAAFFSDIEFQGFNLELVRQDAMRRIGDHRLVLKLAIIGAMRGNNPKDATTMKVDDRHTLEDYLTMYDFHRGGGTRPGKQLSLTRLAQAFAEPVALSLQRVHETVKPLPKRYMENRLPPYLEFMGAGALQLPPSLRVEHRIFAHEFSISVRSQGGSFNRELYQRMEQNSERTRRLNLNSIKLEGPARSEADEELALRELYGRIA